MSRVVEMLSASLRIVATKEPVHRRSVPFRSKASEVLARHGRLRLLYRAVREVLMKPLGNISLVWSFQAYAGFERQTTNRELAASADKVQPHQPRASLTFCRLETSLRSAARLSRPCEQNNQTG